MTYPCPAEKTTNYTGLDFKIFFNLFLLLIYRTNIYKTQKLLLKSRMNFDNLICKPVIFIQYYTIIDFNEVDIRIYLPEKVIIHRGCQAEVNITFKG